MVDFQLPIANFSSLEYVRPQTTVNNRQLEIDNAKRSAPPVLSNWRGENIRVGSGVSRGG
jgi:hypothetical protein